ncbi:DUF6894 family protein [Bradyrhizobium sp. sBnM-33]|uniref:DUF6894 family protein n=1 Tax=Bradyrhizobium sp. sBnM-33 TaxID=2831780 RepID=UPI001BCF478B|nr:hypothetical protein [Bradyrhizobium sp. sBnM-33]WOH53528.1 hypothetical protein RX328_16410 [Bradyrhizobium sp. sBnM-33]
MARFYFHLRDQAELLKDVEGVELKDLSEARRLALCSARELLANSIKSGSSPVAEAFVIADENGQSIETVRLADVLPESLRK